MSRTLLITPLTALARQQADRLKNASSHEIRLWAGGGMPNPPPLPKSGAIIASPEQVTPQSPRWGQLREWAPDFLVVDEAHCFWDWGDGFRPAFELLPELPSRLKIHRSLWLTATLPFEARHCLMERLPNPNRLLGMFSLPSGTTIQTRRVEGCDRLDALSNWIDAHPEPGLIFAQTRLDSERLSRLVRLKRRTVTYHAGLSQEERRNSEASIARFDVVVATSAFGMGLDYPHLRWVLLWQPPPSLLALTQSIGRAGRSGLKSEAMVFWSPDDFERMEWMTAGSRRKHSELLAVWNYLKASSKDPAQADALLRNHFDGPGENTPKSPKAVLRVS